MSKGPGKIERGIQAVFTTVPDDAFTVEDLAERVFPGVNRIEKKHRVSVLRAAKNVCERMDGWTWWSGESRGGTLIFWCRYNVLSYASARLKADFLYRYRHKDTRYPQHLNRTPEQIRAMLAPEGEYYEHVVVGGAWWRHVQMNIADRDGDTSEEVMVLYEAENRVRRLLRVDPITPPANAA